MTATSRMKAIGRAAWPDLAAFVAIGLVVTVSRLHYVRHGLCFDDPSWFFHFGHRIVDGATPYKDFVFQVGPLPIYVDAAFQHVFGVKYAASLDAAIALTIVRVFVMWLVVKQLAGWRAAAAIAVFAAFEPTFATAHHWSTQYAQLFIVVSGLCFVHAAKSDGRRALVFLVLAGIGAALVVSSRQSSAVMIGVVVFVATAIMLARKQWMTVPRFAALWGGFALGFLLVFGALAIVGAAGPAIQQMFLDAPQKKNVHGLEAVLDAISGGSLVDLTASSWLTGLLFWLGIPMLVVAGIIYAAARERKISSGTLAMLVVPAALILGWVTRFASFNFFSDLPRTFLTVVVAFAVIFPERLRAWFGLEPIAAIGLAAVPLASDMAMEMSFPGRGWGDSMSLVTGAILVTLASQRLAARLKLATCIALGATAFATFVVYASVDANPFAQLDSADGLISDNSGSYRLSVLRGMRLSEGRRETIHWLTSVVTAGSTCFVYGNDSVLYDLLGCMNPTRIDTTAADFITADDADEAVAVLRAHPPDFILAHDAAWMNPKLSLDLGCDVTRYDGLNPRASRAIHCGLRTIIDQYESLGTVGDAIGPYLAKQIGAQRDHVDQLRVYRRRR